MKEIKYKNKTYKLPFAVSLPEDPTAEEKISNRFGGGSCWINAALQVLLSPSTFKVVFEEVWCDGGMKAGWTPSIKV